MILLLSVLAYVSVRVDALLIPSPPRPNEFYKIAANQFTSYYLEAKPFPYIAIDDFFPDDIVNEVLKDFSIDDGAWRITLINVQYKKLEVETFAPASDFLISHMKSSAFVSFLEELTQIPGLVPDPHYFGSGLHQTLPGGHLGIHLDYNFNERIQMWRRINVFLYFNKGWEDAWGGHLELWDADMTHPMVAIAPLFNRLVVFEASEHSWHGHPDPLRCPENESRKSIAMYYYTANDNPMWERVPRKTHFMPRPGVDSWAVGDGHRRKT